MNTSQVVRPREALALMVVLAAVGVAVLPVVAGHAPEAMASEEEARALRTAQAATIPAGTEPYTFVSAPLETVARYGTGFLYGWQPERTAGPPVRARYVLGYGAEWGAFEPGSARDRNGVYGAFTWGSGYGGLGMYGGGWGGSPPVMPSNPLLYPTWGSSPYGGNPYGTGP